MKYFSIMICMLGILACSNRQAPNADNADSVGIEEATETVYSLEENIGTMLLVGFRGTELDSTKNPEIITALRDHHVGSVILFDYDVPTGTRGRNIQSAEQLRKLCSQLLSYNRHLLIGIDQEGGYVSRLSTRYGFPRIPSAQKLGIQPEDTLRHYASLTGEMLSSLGINLDFAPVADVNINPRCPVIGGIERSFSDNPERVKDYCRLWIETVSMYHVVSCLKHFPGHGSATGDTHMGLVDVTDTWQRSELLPYTGLHQNTLDRKTMVMTAHVINRQLDPSGLPASLSPRITSYLRDTLGFQGVIVTDDLAMGAIVQQYSFEQAVRMAVLAGADLLCLSNNGGTYDRQMVPRAVKVIKQMIDEGSVDEKRIQHSAERVRRLWVQSDRADRAASER